MSDHRAYETRDDEGTQASLDSLEHGAGSCRDFAIRSPGLGARLVSGYLHDLGAGPVASSGAGTTPAWAEVYLPSAGWITFDPTDPGGPAPRLVEGPGASAGGWRGAEPKGCSPACASSR